MHTGNFNLKKFNVMSQQSISSHQLKTHMAIQHINDDEYLKIVLKVKMSSLLMIMNLQVIINNAFCILKELIK